MAIVDKKKRVFGKIAATKTLTDGLPRLRLSSSYSSINNRGNSINFLTDLIKSLVEFGELVNTVVDTFTNALPKVEQAVKQSLKVELKSIVSCGVNPNLPPWMKSTGSGITIQVNKFDFMDILRTDPNSVGGKLLYNDVTTPLTNSTDFNTFLFGVINDPSVPYTWNNIMTFTFNEIGVGGNPNNTLNIKAAPNYDNKSLTDLNNDFIDSLTLLYTDNVLNRIMDVIYGSISSNIGKSFKQLDMESKINNIVDKMSNNVNKTNIDDAAFNFSNDELLEQQQEAIRRKNGEAILKTSNEIPSTVPIEFLSDFTDEYSGATTTEEKKLAISSNLNKMANASTANVPNPTDVLSTKLDFIQQILNNLIKSIVSIVLSPKVILVFIINYKIVYGQNATFTDPLDFIKKNKNLMSNIIKIITEELIKILLALALKEISALVAKAVAKKQKEKNLNRLAQLQTLVGVPYSTIKNILDSLI
jgi:hypothetical protein